jgi:hypothetical protein
MNFPTLLRLFGLSPKLRCWPGCTAIVVSDTSLTSRLLAGRSFKVVKCMENRSAEPAWTYVGPLVRLPMLGTYVECIPDAILRPITPRPGEFIVTNAEQAQLYAMPAEKNREHA